MAFDKGTEVFINDALYVAVSDVPDPSAITITLSKDFIGITTSQTSFTLTIEFSNPVTGFGVSDFSLTNASVSNITGSGSSYTATITPIVEGEFTIQVLGAGIVDADIEQDLPVDDSEILTLIYDTEAPSVTISSGVSSPTNLATIPITITFSEAVDDITVVDLTTTNCTVDAFTKVSSSEWTANLLPSSQGEVTVSIADGVTQDASGRNNIASNELSWTYDVTKPKPVITSSENDPTTVDPVPIFITFGEEVTGFDQTDVSVQGGTIATFTTTDNITFNLGINPNSSAETIIINVAADVCTDLAGNTNLAASEFSIDHDSSGPTPVISSSESSPTNQNPIPITVQWDEDVLNFTLADLTVGNATAQNLVPVDANTYTAEIVPTGDGQVTVDIAAGAAEDSLGNSSVAATQFVITYDATAPVVSNGAIISSNVTENTADFSWAKATDVIADDLTLVYKLYRALENPESPEDSDLTTLSEIDTNGTLVATGTDVATLSEDGTNIVQDSFYKYNVIVEDGAGNRALYTQTSVQYVSPTVNNVTINESFTYQDQADGTVQLSATIDAINVDNLTINWSSSNTEIATVDANGLVTFVATGEVTITAESDFDNTVKDTLTFTIYEFSSPSEESAFTTTV